MRFSTQLHKAGLAVPPGFRHQRTSALLSRGLLAHLGYPGLPTYTPIGVDVLTRIEHVLATAAERSGFSRIQIPSIMKDLDLGAGEPVGEQFLGKILFLSDTLDGYHLMTSPEMLLVGALGEAQLSHRDLPMRVSYLTDIFRQMRNTRSILRLRQFRVLGGLALARDADGVRAGLEDLVTAATDTLSTFGVAAHAEWRHDPLHVELFCPSTEGSTNISDPGSLTGKSKALSLAVGYHYAAGIPPVANYRSADNSLEGAGIATYALCTNRVLYAVFDSHRDRLGFALPAALRPFDVVVVPADASAVPVAERLYATLSANGVRTALDDRVNRPLAARRHFADYIGAVARLDVTSVGAVSGTLRGGMDLPVDSGDPGAVLRAVRRLLANPDRSGGSLDGGEGSRNGGLGEESNDSGEERVPCPTAW